jgi:hypothetical protein
LERRGIPTGKGDHNRLVEEHNAVVIDLAKAREERRQLHVENGIRERYSSRLGRGWLPVHAQAVAKLEFTLGRAELTYASTAQLADGYRQEQCGLAAQVRAIHEEGQSLQLAAKTLERRQAAAEYLERLNSPASRMKRWFSEGARRELAHAEGTLRTLDQAARRLGTATEPELQAQRNRWETDRARLPQLEGKVAALGQLLDLAVRALDGFAQEQEREHDWLIRAKRARNRGSGLDR